MVAAEAVVGWLARVIGGREGNLRGDCVKSSRA